MRTTECASLTAPLNSCVCNQSVGEVDARIYKEGCTRRAGWNCGIAEAASFCASITSPRALAALALRGFSRIACAKAARAAARSPRCKAAAPSENALLLSGGLADEGVCCAESKSGKNSSGSSRSKHLPFLVAAREYDVFASNCYGTEKFHTSIKLRASTAVTLRAAQKKETGSGLHVC